MYPMVHGNVGVGSRIGDEGVVSVATYAHYDLHAPW
jgi:hypothetical protein